MPDAEAARRDVGAFGAMAGVPLEGWQTDALSLESRITAIVAPRQGGKSRGLSVLAAWWAFTRPGSVVLVVSATEEASKRLLRQVRDLIAESELLAPSIVDEQTGLLVLSNGSEVRSVPASERAVRGWTVDLLLIDEAALVSDEIVLGAAFPTTAARPDARIVLASSATVASGAFYDFVRRGEAGSEHVRTFHWRLADCWWISPSLVEAMRDSMTELRFRAEMEGEFASGADALFSRGALERVTADYVPLAIEDLRGPARLLGGVDWGATIDRSAFVAIGRLPIDERRVFGVVCAKRWPAGEPLERVISAIAESPGIFDTLAMETNGLGLPCAQELARRIKDRSPGSGGGRRLPRSTVLDAEDFEAWAEGRRSLAPRVGLERGFRTRPLSVHTTAEMKAAAYSSLRLLVDQERFVLPAASEDLLRELLMLRVDLTPSGTERIEAGSGHDDLADALMLAGCPFRDRHDGRWSTLLAHYSDPRRPLPEPPAGLRDIAGSTVATGGGLEIPRLPVWQSVRGADVSLPEGVELRPRHPESPKLAAMRESVVAALTTPTNEHEEDPDG